MENYFNTIPIYQILVLLVIGALIKFVFRVIDTYVFPLEKKQTATDNALWQRVQIILWLVYALVFFSVLFVENKLITVVITTITISLGWNYWINVFSGILIKLNNQLKIGDLIETDFTSGKVQSIHLSYTKILNEKGEVVVIPNAKLRQSVRKHQNKKEDLDTHIFTLNTNQKLSYKDVYKQVLNCPYIAINKNITVEKIKENEFQIKASLIDPSFVDKVVQFFA